MNGFLRFGLMLAGLIVVLILTLAAFQLPIVDSVKLIFEGAFADKFAWSRSAVKMTPLLLTGLGMVIAWRAGVYNIGGEGQFVVGAIFGAAIGKALIGANATGMPGGSVLILGGCAVGGAIWAWFAGWLYVRRGVEVVISTILLNFIAIQLLGYAVSGPLQEQKRQVPQSDLLPESLMLARFDRQTDVHWGTVLAVVMAVLLTVFLYRTVMGYRLRLVGDNPKVARVNYIDPGKVQLSSMALSGAMCGLAGGVEYLGLVGQLGTTFPQQWGFLGIPVALLGGLNPMLTAGAAFFFGALFAGTENLARFTPAGTTIVYVIQATAVLAYVGLSGLKKVRPKPEEETESTPS